MRSCLLVAKLIGGSMPIAAPESSSGERGRGVFRSNTTALEDRWLFVAGAGVRPTEGGEDYLRAAYEHHHCNELRLPFSTSCNVPERTLTTRELPSAFVKSWISRVETIRGPEAVSDSCSERWSELNDRMAALAKLPDGWDGDDAPAPSAFSIDRASRIMRVLQSSDLIPSRIDASVEGGVAISFEVGQKYADFECFNTGELVASTWDRPNEPNIWDLSVQGDDIARAASKIREFLGDGTTATHVSFYAPGGSTF